MTTTLLQLDDLVVGYHGRPLLPPISLEVGPGEQWALIGPNGSGKTTLLRTLLGLLPAISGDVTLGSEANIGYVPQRASLSGETPGRVIDLVRGGIDQGWSFLDPLFVRRHAAEVTRAMQDGQVEDLAHQQYRTLSEGQKQRVLVARALAANPQLLVLDEPTAAMDLSAERGVFELLARLREDRGLAVLVVSHHLTVAARHATHAILVDKDRRFAASGPMEEIAAAEETTERYGRLLLDALSEANP